MKINSVLFEKCPETILSPSLDLFFVGFLSKTLSWFSQSISGVFQRHVQLIQVSQDWDVSCVWSSSITSFMSSCLQVLLRSLIVRWPSNLRGRLAGGQVTQQPHTHTVMDVTIYRLRVVLISFLSLWPCKPVYYCSDVASVEKSVRPLKCTQVGLNALTVFQHFIKLWTEKHPNQILTIEKHVKALWETAPSDIDPWFSRKTFHICDVEEHTWALVAWSSEDTFTKWILGNI